MSNLITVLKLFNYRETSYGEKMNANQILRNVRAKKTNSPKPHNIHETNNNVSIQVIDIPNKVANPTVVILEEEISQITYSPIRQRLNEIIKSNTSTKYSDLCDFMSNLFKLIIKQSGSLYLNPHHYSATSSLLKLRDSYFFTKDSVAPNSQVIFKIIGKILPTLSESQVSQFIVSTILYLGSYHDAIKEQTNPNIKNLIKFREFIYPIYEEIILPNKGILAQNISQEDKLAVSGNLFLFSMFSTEDFQTIVELFSNPEMRTISSKFIFKNNSTNFPNFDYLLNNFNGWLNKTFINKIISDPTIVNNVFSIIYEKNIIKCEEKEKNKIIALIKVNIKALINSNIKDEQIFYFIDTFFSESMDEKISTIAFANKHLPITSIIAHYPNIIDDLSSNPSYTQDRNIFSLINKLHETTTFTIATTDEQWVENLIYFQHHRDIVKFKIIFGITPFIERGLSTFATILANKDKLLEELVHSLSNDEAITFFNSIKQIKESTDEQIKIVLTVAAILRKRQSILKQTDQFIYDKLKVNNYFNDPFSFFNKFLNSVSQSTQVYYFDEALNNQNHLDLISQSFDILNLNTTSETHKKFFIFLVSSINKKNNNDIYKKGFIDLALNHPIHKLLDNMIKFYSIESNALSALEDNDFSLNQDVWSSLKELLLFTEKYYNILFLQQVDTQKTSIRDKLYALNGTIDTGRYEKQQIKAYNYSDKIVVSRGSKILFWQKDVYDNNPSYRYLYITPQGPMFSDETLVEFIGEEDIIEEVVNSWKDMHEEKTKQAYIVLKHADIPTEISLQTKDLIRNFKKIAESIEPIKEYLDFEELMFFEQSFFQDIINMLNAQKASSLHAKVLKSMSPGETLTILDQEQQHSLKIIELLQKQMDNISQDLILNLKSKSDFDLAVLAEYIQKRQAK